MDTAELQRLADRMAIHDVLTRYFHAVDHGDLAELESCFTADVEAVYDGTTIAAGREQLVTFFREGRGSVKGGFVDLQHRMHFISNVTVSLQQDTASTETYALAHLVDAPPEGSRLRTRALRYTDELRREDGEWRICRRRHASEWSTTQSVDLLSDRRWLGWRRT